MATVTLRMTLLSPQPNGKNLRAFAPCLRVKRAVGRIWRKFIADEQPDEKERLRQKRIDNILHDVVLMEAMRRWELETKRQEVSKDGPLDEE